MGIPQIIIIVLLGINLGAGMVQHGKPKTGKNSFWVSLVACALEVSILWWGGFWS
jgi:hypothetical protein